MRSVHRQIPLSSSWHLSWAAAAGVVIVAVEVTVIVVAEDLMPSLCGVGTLLEASPLLALKVALLLTWMRTLVAELVIIVAVVEAAGVVVEVVAAAESWVIVPGAGEHLHVEVEVHLLLLLCEHHLRLLDLLCLRLGLLLGLWRQFRKRWQRRPSKSRRRHRIRSEERSCSVGRGRGCRTIGGRTGLQTSSTSSSAVGADAQRAIDGTTGGAVGRSVVGEEGRPSITSSAVLWGEGCSCFARSDGAVRSAVK